MTFSTFHPNDISIVRHLHGVKCVPSSQLPKQPSITLNELDQLAVSIYFVNHESNFCHVNDNTVVLVGRNSIKEVIGKNAKNFCHDELASICVQNDKKVQQSQTTQLFDETGYRDDECLIQQISFKMPWYTNDKLSGSLGISIYTSADKMTEFADTLNSLFNIGILSLPRINKAPTHFLSHKEHCVLHLLAKGYTAKRIGKTLSLSHRTVENHIARMKIKLNCYNKADLIDFYENNNE